MEKYNIASVSAYHKVFDDHNKIAPCGMIKVFFN